MQDVLQIEGKFNVHTHVWSVVFSKKRLDFIPKGSFTNYVDKILPFFDHLPSSVDNFYGINVDKKWTFLDHLPTLSFKRCL